MVMTSTGLGGGQRIFERVLGEARANPRILIGLAVILLLLWGYGLIGLIDSVDAAGRRFADTEIEIKRATGLVGEAGWDVRAAEAEALKAQLLLRLWTAETEGQAQADFQEALARAARESGLVRTQVRGDREPTEIAGLGVHMLGATISADFAPEPLSSFLLKLAEIDRTIHVRSLRATRQPLARLDMLVATYHGPPTQGACAAPPAQPASSMLVPGR